MIKRSYLARQLVKFSLFITLFTQLLLAPCAIAGESYTGWKPDPAKHDWVQLTSGEWLSGKIHSMYRETLEFDSEKLDLLSIDWEDVKSLQSHQLMRVLLAKENAKKDMKKNPASEGKIANIFGGKIRNEVGEKVSEESDILTGLLKINGDLITLTRNNQVQSFHRDRLISFAPAGQKEIDLWTLKAGLSLNLQRGNVKQLDYTAKASAKRRTAKTRFFIDYIGNFSQTDTISGQTQKTINNHRVTDAFDIYANRYLFYTPFNSEFYRDPFRNIDQRITLGTGIGLILTDTKQTTWEITTGPSFLTTKYSSVLANEKSRESSFALMLGTKLDTELTSKLDFIFKYDIKASKKKSGGYSHHLIATLENDITERIDIDLSFLWDRINHPTMDSQGKLPKPDDYRIMMGVDFSCD